MTKAVRAKHKGEKLLTVWIPDSQHDALLRHAKESDMSMSQVIRKLLRPIERRYAKREESK